MRSGRNARPSGPKVYTAASAFRDLSSDSLGHEVRRLLARFKVKASPVQPRLFGLLKPPTFDESLDALIFPPQAGWTVVRWPRYFHLHDLTVCEHISRALGVLVSTVHVYASEYWTHVLFREGQLLDRFASRPEYFATTSEQAARLRGEWRGNAAVISSALGVKLEEIAPYLVHLSVDVGPGVRVHDDDVYVVEDVRVFKDFWRRLGVHYPEDPGACAQRLRVGRDIHQRLVSDGWHQL